MRKSDELTLSAIKSHSTANPIGQLKTACCLMTTPCPVAGPPSLQPFNSGFVGRLLGARSGMAAYRLHCCRSRSIDGNRDLEQINHWPIQVTGQSMFFSNLSWLVTRCLIYHHPNRYLTICSLLRSGDIASESPPSSIPGGYSQIPSAALVFLFWRDR